MHKRIRKKWINSEIAPFVSGQALGFDAEELELDQLATAWAMVEHVRKLCDARSKELKKLLLEQAKIAGTPGKNGHVYVEVDDCTITREKRVSKVPDANQVRNLLTELGLDPDSAFEKITEMKLSPSKLQYLIETGKVPAASVEALRKVIYALRVDVSRDITDIFEALATSKR